MKKLMTLFLSFILALSALAGGMLTAAADTVEREFDSTPVLDDLTSSKDEDGNAFDLTDYPYDENGRVQLITLVEYCYSYATNMRDNYALYLYLYNPTGREIVTDSDLNKAQFAVSYDDEGKPDDYEQFDVVFCNKSTGDYNNLFYKFRVADHESADGMTMGERVNSNARRYDISGVEIIHAGQDLAKEYGCGGTYIYSGYAAGYGPEADAESTLTCDVTDLETLRLEVMPTQYRPDGYYTGGHQSQLNSVYFAVPNDVLEEYGRKITEIKARWDEYKTGLIGVFDDKEAYDIYSPYVGKNIDEETLDYALIGNYEYQSWPPFGGFSESGDWVYNENAYTSESGQVYNLLTAAFYTNGQSADKYSITSERMEKALKEYSATADGDKINGVYSTDLFVDYVDEGHTRGENVRSIDSGTEYNLTAQVLNEDFWLNFLGIRDYITKEYDGIKAIEEVDYDEIRTADASLISQELYINPDDVATFKDYCKAAHDTDKTVYIFRFSVTDYYATRMSNRAADVAGAEDCGYAAQMTVFLNFKIIELTFYDDGNYTVIPVVSDPIDIIPGVTPPLPEAEDTDWGEVIARILLYFMLVIIVIAAVGIAVRLFVGLLGSRQKVTIETAPPPDGSGSRRKGNSYDYTGRQIKRAQKSANTAKYAQKEGNKSAGKSKNSGKNKGNTGGKAHSKAAGKTGGGKAVGKANSRKK